MKTYLKRSFAIALSILSLLILSSANEAKATTYYTFTSDAHQCMPIGSPSANQFFSGQGFVSNNSSQYQLDLYCPLANNQSSAGSAGLYYTSPAGGGVTVSLCSIDGGSVTSCSAAVGAGTPPGNGVLYPSVANYNANQSDVLWVHLAPTSGGGNANRISNYYVTLAVQ